MKDTRQEGIDYPQFADDVRYVAARMKLRFEDCWKLAKFSPLQASRCYRAIVNSYGPVAKGAKK